MNIEQLRKDLASRFLQGGGIGAGESSCTCGHAIDLKGTSIVKILDECGSKEETNRTMTLAVNMHNMVGGCYGDEFLPEHREEAVCVTMTHIFIVASIVSGEMSMEDLTTKHLVVDKFETI